MVIFSEYHTFSVTDFVSCMPPKLLLNLGLTLEEVVALPKKEPYFAMGIVPDESSFVASACPEESDIELTNLHRYPLHSQQPRIVPGGGLQRLVTSKEFPISSTLSGSIIELQPGALREMHWYPSADGNLDSDLVIVEYGDYQCQYCGAAYPILKELISSY